MCPEAEGSCSGGFAVVAAPGTLASFARCIEEETALLMAGITNDESDVVLGCKFDAC